MQISDKDGVMTVELTGEIDHHTASSVRNKVDSALARKRPSGLVLDFSKVTFMDSSGVGLVLGRYKRTNEMHCSLAVSGLSPRDSRMMKMSGLQDLIEFR